MKSINEELREVIGAVKKYIEMEELAMGEVTKDEGRLSAEAERGSISAKEERTKDGIVLRKAEGRSEQSTIPPSPKENFREDRLRRTGAHRRYDADAPLDTLKKEVLLCTKCELCKTRTKVVFGSGDPKAKLMFIGEAPGMEEDLQGLPFVGRAGQLLTKIIASMGLKRQEVYITNVVKCRPPNNRNPLPTEILTCEEYLIKQIELIRPEVICGLGKFAAQTLLRSQEPITKLRGKFYDYRQAKLMPTFHPAYLLRNPQDKRLVWEDMKKIKRQLSKDG